MALTADMFALVWFYTCWIGYTWFADHSRYARHGLMRLTHLVRIRWSLEMLERDNNVTDSNLVGNLMRSVSFFANTTIFIIAGLIAALGAQSKLEDAVAHLPFLQPTNGSLYEVHLLVLLSLFIYAYFKFSWSLRLYNFITMLVGNLPARQSGDARLILAETLAKMQNLAGLSFTKAERAYLLSIAALTGFISPLLFLLSTTLVVAILVHRDYFSLSRQALDAYVAAAGERPEDT